MLQQAIDLIHDAIELEKLLCSLCQFFPDMEKYKSAISEAKISAKKESVTSGDSYNQCLEREIIKLRNN